MNEKQAFSAVRGVLKVPDDIQTLINETTFDLYFGPKLSGDEMDNGEPWPGFVRATEILADYFGSVMRGDAWVSDESECVTFMEPEAFETCRECDGDGCEDCDGNGYVESFDTWWRVSVREVLFGRELAPLIY